MPRPTRPLKEKYYDNSGNEVRREKIKFYHEIGVLCQVSTLRYTLNRHEKKSKIVGNFYDKKKKPIPKYELDEYYEEGLMDDYSAKRYEKYKESLEEELVYSED